MNRIKALRIEKGMTQIRLSIELSVSQVAVSAYESGKALPSVRNLLKMSEIFHASCDYILGLSDVRQILNGGELTKDELILLSQYRSLHPSERPMVGAYIQGITDRRKW